MTDFIDMPAAARWTRRPAACAGDAEARLVPATMQIVIAIRSVRIDLSRSLAAGTIAVPRDADHGKSERGGM
jgi:hypothetical protein